MSDTVQEQEKTTLWEDYENGLAYQATCGLSRNLPQFVRFFEGKQWAKSTELTANMPRPVINMIKMICRNKKSAILSKPTRIKYQGEDPRRNVEKFNDFAAYIQKEYGQESLDRAAVDDGVKKGTYIYHYYWDSEARGRNAYREGALRGEIIDPLSIFFANPRERDEQKQKWILIASREDVESVRAKCDKSVDKDMIVSDESDDKYGTKEQEGNKLVTVLTRYFRRNGEVYFEKATKSVIINEARPLAPDVEAARAELEDAPNNSLPDSGEHESLIPGRVRAPLYPIVVGNYEPREGSIYGIGEVEGLIPNQKAVNQTLGMFLLNVQQIAWGKYIALPNALLGQVITDEPGQVLTDHTGTGNGIKKMTEQPIQSQPLQLIDTMVQLTRAMSGANEVMSGEVLGANMSGAAIAQLQSQAQQPIEDLITAFHLVKEKQGKVLAQFFKLFYVGKEYTYKTEEIRTDDMGAPIIGGDGLPMKREVEATGIFNSSEYTDVDFEVVVEIVRGTKSSVAGDINVLDLLLAKGQISLKTYINAYPDDALSNKSELLKGIEEDEQGQLAQLTQQVEQLTQQLESAMQANKEMEATNARIIPLINENKQLRTYLAQLYTEARTRISQANQRNRQTESDATHLAMALAQKEGNVQAPPVVI